MFNFLDCTEERQCTLQSLKYMYTPINEETSQSCQKWDGTEDLNQILTGRDIDSISKLLNTVVCENNETPVMKKFRVEFDDGTGVMLTGVQIYATSE